MFVTTIAKIKDIPRATKETFDGCSGTKLDYHYKVDGVPHKGEVTLIVTEDELQSHADRADAPVFKMSISDGKGLGPSVISFVLVSPEELKVPMKTPECIVRKQGKSAATVMGSIITIIENRYGSGYTAISCRDSGAEFEKYDLMVTGSYWEPVGAFDTMLSNCDWLPAAWGKTPSEALANLTDKIIPAECDELEYVITRMLTDHEKYFVKMKDMTYVEAFAFINAEEDAGAFKND